MGGKLSPSLMCVDLMNMERDIRELEAARVEYLHIDIMDNHFVPNITLSPDIVRAVKRITDIPLDVHLMIERPEQWFSAYDCLGKEDILCFHYEATPHVHRALNVIKQMGVKAGVALNPATPVCMLENLLPDLDMVLLMTVNPGYSGQALVPATLSKIAHTRRLLTEAGFDRVEIEVDGNVSFENAAIMREKGADIYVCGTSSLFHKGAGITENAGRFRALLG